MKQITYILFLFLLPLCIQAQNHVPNGDFEYYTGCPTTVAQTSNCTGWSSFTNTSPDYFNSCATGLLISIPNNFPGHQYAASGNGYVGFVAGTSTFREVVTRAITPLIVGKTYEVSISINLANGYSTKGTDNVSILFYNNVGTISTPTALFNLVPQVNYKSYGPITDTANWVRLTANFTADSAYSNIAIGGFMHDSLITTTTLHGSGNGHAYYLLDSVVVKSPSNFYITNHDTALCVGDSISISFLTSFKRNSNNIFTALLSNSTGNFANATTIGNLATDTSGILKGVTPNTLATGAGYKVKLISSSPKDTFVSPIAIKIANPDSSISIQITSNSPVCAGESLFFVNTSTPSSLTYSWQGPIGFNSTLSNPSISGISTSSAGSYYVTSKLYGCELKDTLQVLVKPLPAKPVATATTPICQYDSLGLTVNSTTSGVNYSWTGANSFTSNSQNPSILNVPTNAGGMYIAAATLNGCSRYDTVSVTVKNAPDTVTLTNNSSICTDDTLKLYSDTSTGNVTYTWTGPNNFTSNSKDTFIANSGVANTGWYKMVVNSNGCTYTDSIYALVTQTPGAPSITFNSPICVGENLNLTATGPTNATYNWTGANSFSSTQKNATRTNITVSDSGNYSVTATLNGCTSLAGSTHVSINPTPFVNILSADSICDGETVTFTALPSNAGSNPQYQWFVNAQLQTAIGSSFTTTSLANNDVIYCEMTDNAKCSVPYTDQSNTKQIKVLPWLAPSVSISSNPTRILQPWEYVTFTAIAVNAGNTPQYQWKRNGQNIVGALGSTWAANNLNDNDTISVELISDYKCPQPTTAKSNSITVSVAVGVDNINKISNIILSPNPNNGQFTLSGTINYNGLAQIEVINMLGQTVYKTSTTIQNNRLQQSINLDGIASGLYLLRLNTNGDVEQIKFRVD